MKIVLPAKADVFDGKHLLEYKTVSNTPKKPELREGEIRALGYVTFLDGARILVEIIAIRGQHLYCYRNEKRCYITRVDGKEFVEIIIERKQEMNKKTWKFVGGKAVKS